ncbi:MAG: outer membrane protein transport protein [Polyangiaceae bacterium]
MSLRNASPGAVAVVLAAVGAAVVPGAALASGFNTARFGGDHGNVTTDNPTAIYFNPAGLADRDPDDKDRKFEFHLFVDGNLAFRASSWEHATSKYDIPEPAGAEGANTGEANLFNVIASPMVGVNFKIKDFAVGAGFYVPFGGQATWDTNEKFAGSKQFPGPVDGVQRWHTINGTLRTMYVSVGAAYDILERVSLGASFNLALSTIETIRAREPGGTNDIDSEGRSLLKLSGLNGAFGVGLLGEVVPRKLWLGFSYQSQPGVIGDMRLTGNLQNNFAGGKTDDPVALYQQLPAEYRFGVRARPADKWEVRFTGELIDWSVFDNQCIIGDKDTACDVNRDGTPKDVDHPPIQNIVRNWGPAFATRIGVSYWVKEQIELFGSFGYDSAAVPASTLEPTLQDYHSFAPSIGAKFGIGKHFELGTSYTHFFYVPRDTTGESILATLEAPSRTPDSGGKYSQTLGLLNVNAQLSF